MIHIAPCSCELHVRIRELEARAEKAEARVAELEAHCCVKTRSGEYWARQDVCRFVNGECIEHWEPEREAD